LPTSGAGSSTATGACGICSTASAAFAAEKAVKVAAEAIRVATRIRIHFSPFTAAGRRHINIVGDSFVPCWLRRIWMANEELRKPKCELIAADERLKFDVALPQHVLR
jgi:hypothetical protein